MDINFRERKKTENPQTELSLLHMSNPFLKITNQQSSAKFSGLRTVYMLGSVHALVTVEQCWIVLCAQQEAQNQVITNPLTILHLWCHLRCDVFRKAQQDRIVVLQQLGLRLDEYFLWGFKTETPVSPRLCGQFPPLHFNFTAKTVTLNHLNFFTLKIFLCLAFSKGFYNKRQVHK